MQNKGVYFADKKTLIKIFGIILFIFLCGCVTLSKSQLRKVNSFVNAVDEITEWPGIVFKETAEIRFRRSLLEHSTLTVEESMFDAVNITYKSYKKELNKSEKFDVSLKLIKTYAECLGVLASGKFDDDLKDSLTNAGNKINGLIEKYNSLESTDEKINSNAGELLKLLNVPGKMYFRVRTSKLLKKYIVMGDEIINKTSGHVSMYLERYIKERLEHEKKRTENIFMGVLKASKKSKPLEYLKIFDIYKKLLEDLENTRELAKSSKRAFDKIGRAHTKLKNDVLGDKKIDEAVKEVYEFYKEVREGREILQENW